MAVELSMPRCEDMAEVRRHIDALDSQIVALLARRTAFAAQAARIKQHAGRIVDEALRRQATELGAPAAIAESAYRALIAASIEFERQEFARSRAQGVAP